MRPLLSITLLQGFQIPLKNWTSYFKKTFKRYFKSERTDTHTDTRTDISTYRKHRPIVLMLRKWVGMGMVCSFGLNKWRQLVKTYPEVWLIWEYKVSLQNCTWPNPIFVTLILKRRGAVTFYIKIHDGTHTGARSRRQNIHKS